MCSRTSATAVASALNQRPDPGTITRSSNSNHHSGSEKGCQGAAATPPQHPVDSSRGGKGVGDHHRGLASGQGAIGIDGHRVVPPNDLE